MVLGILLESLNISSTGLSPFLAAFSKAFDYLLRISSRSPATPLNLLSGLDFARFARHY